MRHFLSLPGPELVELASTSAALFAFDFDGTLAPITARHTAAAMRPKTANLFAMLCAHTRCAVISGRQRRDVLSRLEGARAHYIVGNHGLELDDSAAGEDSAMSAARRELAAVVANMAGVELEEKHHSLSVHYRTAPDPEAANAVLSAAIARIAGVRAVPGKLVINIVPAVGYNKGDALAALMRREGARRALYVGDDVTDEDVFEHEIGSRVVSIRVGKTSLSASRYYLEGQWEIDNLLHTLLTLTVGIR